MSLCEKCLQSDNHSKCDRCNEPIVSPPRGVLVFNRPKLEQSMPHPSIILFCITVNLLCFVLGFYFGGI